MSMQAVIDQLGLLCDPQFGSDGQPVQDDDSEQTRCSCTGVGLVLGDNLDAGSGTLHVTTRRVIWRPISATAGAESEPGSIPAWSVGYQQILMHAMSKDGGAHPRPCVYIQLDTGSEEECMQDDDEDSNEAVQGAGAASHQHASELRLVPDDPSQVDTLFKALCECAALNPDPSVDGEGEFFFNEDEVMAGLDNDTRAAVMAQRMEGGIDLDTPVEEGAELEELVGEDPGRFEDEDEDGYEEFQDDQQPAQNGTAH